MTAKIEQPKQAVQIAATKPATSTAEAAGPAASAASAGTPAVPVSSSSMSARTEQVALQTQEPAL